MSLYEDLKWRGLIKDVAGENLKDLLDGEPITFYWGTDPTADSLHIGHYSSLVTAKRLANYGHHPLLLCGGATGRIGDPRPTAEREILANEVIENNISHIKAQINKLFDGKAEIVDNYDWTKDYTFLEFLRDIGKYINVNYMLNKDIISRRLETGITYAEFSYTLLQGYDFLYLYEHKNCVLQVEGSDQWGNITTGIELIKKKLNKEAYGFTMPLILDSNGNKFGKSAGNALWLDETKTSPYEIYQYLINAEDSKVLEYLKVFTFLTKEEIEDIMVKQNAAPHLRIAQKTLAFEVVKDIHGEDAALLAKKTSEDIFSNRGNSENTFKKVLDKNLIVNGINILDLLVLTDMFDSKSDARRMVEQNAVSINNKKVTDKNVIITIDDLENNELLVQKGKKNFLKLIFE